jgi:hypothetical protein
MPDEVNGRTHRYNAQATIVSGHLRLPLVQEIRSQARITLPDSGGYISQHSDNHRLEGVLSYRSAYTQVAGNRDLKPGHGWTTLTTSVIEGLNVLDVVTADRVVGQTITEHPLEGYVPSVNFLGTRFDNLRIAGNPVALDMNLDVLGAKPANDAFYAHDPGVSERVSSQYKNLLGHGDLPADLRERYNRLSSALRGAETVECSLVNQVTGSFPGRSYGHIIVIPDFGKVVLGKLTVTSEAVKGGAPTATKTTIQLTMIDLEFGCVVNGNLSAAVDITNGQSNP